MAISTVTTSDGLTIDILERGPFGNKRYVIGEITGTSDNNAISYTQGGIGNISPKLFDLDRIDRVSIEMPPNVRNKIVYDDNNFEIIQFPDANMHVLGLDTMTRQSSDDITFLNTISIIGATASSSRIYLLTTLKVYVYDWDGNRQTTEEFDLEPNGEAVPKGITLFNDISIYIGYNNGNIHAYHLEDVDNTHRSQYQRPISLTGINANDRYLAFDETNERIYVGNSSNNQVQVFDYDGNLQLTKELGVFTNDFNNFIQGIEVFNNKLYVVNRQNNSVQPFSLINVENSTISLDDGNTNPHGIAVNENRIFVYDNTANNIYLYQRSDGALQSSETIDVSGLPFHLDHPLVSIDDDNLYTIDNNNGHVYKFERQSDEITWRADSGYNRRDGSILLDDDGDVEGIAFYNNHIYILDTDATEIKVYSDTPPYARNMSLGIDLHSTHANPRELAVTTNRIYVGDIADFAVYVYSHDGTFHGVVGEGFQWSTAQTSIKGLSVTATRIYMVARGQNQVFVYDIAGVRQDGTGGTINEEFALHADNSDAETSIVDESNNRIYVTDTNGSKVFVYDLSGNRQEVEEFDLTETNATAIALHNDIFYIVNNNSGRIDLYEDFLVPEFDLSINNINARALAASSNRFYVYDSSIPRMFVYDHDGNRQNGEEFNLVSSTSGSATVDIAYDEVEELLYLYANGRVYIYNTNGDRQESLEFTNTNTIRGLASYGGQLYFAEADDVGNDDEISIWNLYYTRIFDERFPLEDNMVLSYNGISHNGDRFYVALFVSEDTTYVYRYDNDGSFLGGTIDAGISDNTVIDIASSIDRVYVMTPGLNNDMTIYSFDDSGIIQNSEEITISNAVFEGIDFSRGHLWFTENDTIIARDLDGRAPPRDILIQSTTPIDLGSDGTNFYILDDSGILVLTQDGVFVDSFALPDDIGSPSFINVNDSNNQIFTFNSDGEIVILSSSGVRIGNNTIELDSDNQNTVDLLSDIANNRVYAVDSTDVQLYAYAISLQSSLTSGVEYGDGVDIIENDISNIRFMLIGV